MDPTATLELLRDAFRARDVCAWNDARQDFNTWTNSGGFKPKVLHPMVGELFVHNVGEFGFLMCSTDQKTAIHRAHILHCTL